MKRLSLFLVATLTLGMVTSLLAAGAAGSQYGVLTVQTPPPDKANLEVEASWQSLPDDLSKHAMNAVYSDNALSVPAFSDPPATLTTGTLTGTVRSNETTLPLEGVTITSGEYTGVTDAQGYYSIALPYGFHTVVYSKEGHQSVTENGIAIFVSQTTIKDVILIELTFIPVQLVAEELGLYVNLTWNPAVYDPYFTEGFETNDFPPVDWSQIINNTTVNSLGYLATWHKQGYISTFDANNPHSGSGQAGLWWDYDQQDEWLITPQFTCHPNSILRFWSYCILGSTYGDHFYVKASTDDGNTWTVLWDSATLPIAWNRYQEPITIPLDSIADQYVKLAFHALGTQDNGVHSVWFIDDITIYMPSGEIRFPISEFSIRSSGKEEGGVTFHNSDTNLPLLSDWADYPDLEDSNLGGDALGQDEGKDRAFLGYRVWRFPAAYQNNERRWTRLTPDPMEETSFQDNEWHFLPDNDYQWAVKSIYSGNVSSAPTFSNVITKINHFGTIAGTIRDYLGNPIEGVWVNCSGAFTQTNSDGEYSIQAVSGAHTVFPHLYGYGAIIIENVEVESYQTTVLDIIMPPSLVGFEDGFESHNDFAMELLPWTLVDVDQSPTIGIPNTTWENAHAPQSFIIFNPSATIPPLQNAQPHGGSKVAACFAAVDGANNDWLITPAIRLTNEFRFWARSYNAEHGLARFRFGISTWVPIPRYFGFFHGGDYIEVPEEWTEYVYDLTSYYEHHIYIGINCVSENGSILMVDDVYVHHPPDIDDPVTPVLATTLNANYPNPFNPETTITYSLQDASPVTIEIYNIKGQLVKTLVNESKASGTHSVVWNGQDARGHTVSSGIYYYKMHAGKYSSTRKMILMK